jgi:hypothetical protein
MSNSKGWISLHRKLLENPIFKNYKLLQTFLYCLLKATHDDYELLIGDQMVSLKKGQLATGRKAISQATNLTEQNVRTALSKLEKLGILTITPTSKYSVVTVVAWDSYQGSNQQVTNNQPTTNQQLTTNNNINNKNNIKKGTKKFVQPTQSEVCNYFLEKGLAMNECSSESLKYINHYESNGWKVGKNKMKNWKASASGWLTRRNDYAKNRPNTTEQDSINWDDTSWADNVKLKL